MMKRLLPVAFLATLATAQLDQKTNKENMVFDRGETSVFRGSNPLTLYGILFDAGCKDRSVINLASPPESLTAAMPAETPAEAKAAKNKTGSGGVTSKGITVGAKTLTAERADILQHQVRDLLIRQMEPSCSITGGTSAYAVLLDDGRQLNLDEGGNTFASEAVLLSKQGRAMLNGEAYGFKPRVRIAGRIRGDRVAVQQLEVM